MTAACNLWELFNRLSVFDAPEVPEAPAGPS